MAPPPQQKFSVLIRNKDWHFNAPASLTLLVAARLSGVTLPSSCRNGTCRTCMCRMTEGRVTYRIEWPGLSPEEKNAGWILPCVAYPTSDVVLEVPRASRTAGHGVR